MLLLIGSGEQAYRDYLLESIAREYRIWLLSDELSWQRPYVVGSTVLDTLDFAATTAAARRVAEATRVDGVFCFDEARILTAAQVVQALGLRGADPEVIYRCRDKHATRAALKAAGVPQPESMLAFDIGQAWAAAHRIGYPLVVKPRALIASEGVMRVDSPDDLEQAFGYAASATLPEAPSFNRGVLIEEYVDGPEVSVDSLGYHHGVVPVFLARKCLGFDPYFAEVGHVLNGADPLLEDRAVTEVVIAAVEAVGYELGWSHVEVRLSSKGPKVIEINARPGGGLIPYLGMLATGIDPGLAGAAVACGRKPDIRPRFARVAAVRYCHPERDMVVGRVVVDESSLPPAVIRVRGLARRGQKLLLPPRSHLRARFGYVIAMALTERECLEALDAASGAVAVEPAEALSDDGVQPNAKIGPQPELSALAD